MSSANANSAIEDAIECGIARGWSPERIIRETGCQAWQLRQVWQRMEALVADDKDVEELRRHRRAIQAHEAMLRQALSAQRRAIPKRRPGMSMEELVRWFDEVWEEPQAVKRGRLLEATREADAWGRSNTPSRSDGQPNRGLEATA